LVISRSLGRILYFVKNFLSDMFCCIDES
jgi:hypothetical protein